MTIYFRRGSSVNLEPNDALEVSESLPVGTYTVRKNPNSGELYLESTNSFTLPNKTYGDTVDVSARIVNTFNSRSRSTGVLLSGDKGSGKTLLTKKISVDLMASGVSTIIINEPWCGQPFNDLIGKIQEPAVIIFDEFDKVYDSDDQKLLLTLLDGVVETKKLFILTMNSSYVDQHLINRPGRIYYHLEYAGIEKRFIEEYADDNLINKNNIDGILSISNTFATFTFDMLQALVEEMNRYNETASNAIRYMNINGASDDIDYVVSIENEDGEPYANNFYPREMSGYPIGETVWIEQRKNKRMASGGHIDLGGLESDGNASKIVRSGSDDNEVNDYGLQLTENNLVKHNSKSGMIRFRDTIGSRTVIVVLKREKRFKFNYDAL